MKIHEVIVVGSGCSGSMVAQTLVEAGMKVTMVDAGVQKPSISIPPKDFATIRQTDPNQYKYLVGGDLAKTSWGGIQKGAQVTPPRQYITKNVDKYIPVKSDSFSPFESLAYGGLGVGWGLLSCEYPHDDLKKIGLSPKFMDSAYQVIGDRIGVSGKKDDTGEHSLGRLKNYQSPINMDDNGQLLYKNYLEKKQWLNQSGFSLGRTPLAVITKDKGQRKAYSYKNMDFYSDADRSAWRPWITVNQLKKQPNFSYIGNSLAVKFVEKKDYTELHCLSLSDNKTTVLGCKRLILATGALGSARIVLRSVDQADTKLPLLCNPYSYIPCVQPSLLGKKGTRPKVGFSQLMLAHKDTNPKEPVTIGSIFSYESLMLFRLSSQFPLGFKEARILLQYIQSGLVIAGVHHADTPSPDKYLQLASQSGKTTSLKAVYKLSGEEQNRRRRKERLFMRAMRKMHAYPLKVIDPGYGSSVHYAGTVPFNNEDKPLTLSPEGRLHGTKAVFVADSSGFNYLPAGGLTFTLMANAHLMAERIAKNA